MGLKILVVNAGSSSLKYKLFIMPEAKLLEAGKVERIGEKGSSVRNHHQAVKHMFRYLLKDKTILKDLDEISGIGHRVVHGGQKINKPLIINNRVLRVIKDNFEIAPLHNPANLEGIKACKKVLPGVKQVAVFDTAFHQTIPEYAYIYSIPYRYYKKYRIRRYGFHGTSHQYVAQEAARILKKPLNRLNLITCHLGNGCSMSAIKNGKSVDTSMGFTPLEGLVMGTRCGDIDPALIIFLMEKEKLRLPEIYKILNRESGLLGVSGVSNDIRILVKKAHKNKLAKLALDIFIYRVRKYLGAYICILGGVDAIIFTAGIGENNPWMIRRITWGLGKFLKKTPRIMVIPTDEEKMIALHTYRLVKGGGR